MEKKEFETVAQVLDKVRPGAGALMKGFAQHGLPPAMAAFALEPTVDEEIKQGHETLRNAEQRARKHQKKIAELQSKYDQLKRRRPSDPVLADLHRQLADLRRIHSEMNDEVEKIRATLKQAVALAAGEPDPVQNARDVDITVGYMAYPSTARGPIPLYPVIEVEFPSSVSSSTIKVPRQLTLSYADRKYKVFEPGCESTPFAELDAPLSEETHEIFQRLYAHWGFWFLRVVWSTGQRDFRVSDGASHPVEQPIEDLLRLLGLYTRDQLLSAATGPEQVVVTDGIDRFEALVGPLPAARTGLVPEPGVLHACVVHRGGQGQKARTQFVRLDPANVVENIEKIVGGPCVSLLFEDVRPGIHFEQFMQRSEDTKGVRGPDIWLRWNPAVRGTPHGRTDVIDSLGTSLPQEILDPKGCRSMFEDDVPYVLRHYVRQGQNDNGMRTVSRIQLPSEPEAREVDRSMHESIIANYLMLCQTVRVAAAGNDANAQKVMPFLRDAVIFEMPPITYRSLFEQFFEYCVRSARVDPKIALHDHTAKQRKRVYDVIGTGADAPFPEKLPFRSCFFAYGAGVRESGAELLSTELMRLGSPGNNIGLLYGHLVTDTGMVVGFRHLDGPKGEVGIAFTFDRDPSVERLGARWDRPYTLSPWIINALVSYVNEHKTLVEQGKRSFGYERLVKRTAKAMNVKPPVPPPFYVVYLKDEFMRERVRERGSAIKRHIDWQHRWKVRGHDCIRFLRGPLPIDPKLEEELLKRRYKIFTTTQPDADTFADLLKRGVPPKRDSEWFAVLKYWRDSFEKGPADKPLIESVRRSAKDWSEAS